jgi:hypothetical protein
MLEANELPGWIKTFQSSPSAARATRSKLEAMQKMTSQTTSFVIDNTLSLF